MPASHHIFIVLSLLTSSSFILVYGKVYSPCELARELYWWYGVPEHMLADFVCIAKHESSFNSNIQGPRDWDGSYDHGLFQINDRYWCGRNGASKECNIDCADLKDDDLTDDIECVAKIYARHGFKAWAAWIKHCQGENVKSDLYGCEL
ncbi:lysozyme-like [Ornithodoros turicata]|uniref:lysozyme-like n=1 Tax=Ornithodoros turicata TaxID=34597 RepID=UPI0031390D35